MKKILFLLLFLPVSAHLWAAGATAVKSFYRPPLTTLKLLQKNALWNADSLAQLQKFVPDKDKKLQEIEDDVVNIPQPHNLLIGGFKPKQLRLQIRNGKLQSLEFYFANKGDALDRENVKRQIKLQSAQLEKVLTASFGTPQKSVSGVGKLRVINGRKWVDRDRVIFLKSEPNEYLMLQIISRQEMDLQSKRKTARVSAVKAELSSRVKQTVGGDVFISNIPMVDQGQKGYCVPATMERIFTYYKVPNVGMHRIADLAKSDKKKGTTLAVLKKNLIPVMTQVGLKMTIKKLTMTSIRNSINQGHLMMVALYATQEYEARMAEITKLHGEIKNPVQRRKAEKKLPRVRKMIDGAHICLVIGYNLESNEVAVSNSWGEKYDMTWVRYTDLLAVSLDGTIMAFEPR